MRDFYSTLVLLTLSTILLAQQPKFNSPVDIPIILNGNFGEIRGNHFHSGIDIKTKGEIGLPVYSIDDGFISRISVSAFGYGYSIYIDHPSGYTSVYGHLDKFSPKISDWVKKQQYLKKSFEVNLFPEKNLFVLKKGNEIAKSGNSGSSAGPHLHFEIRKTASEHPINPLFFNFEINDETKPTVENLFVYPLGDNSQVENKTEKQKYELVFYGNAYHIKGIQTLNCYGEIGFGIDAIDYLDNNWSKCGIYQLEYWLDNKLMNSFELYELDFDKTRYINSHIDYEAYKKNSQKIHKTFIEPGNKLNIYQQSLNNGVYNFNDKILHKIKIILYDTKMNATEIQFNAVSTSPIQHTIKENTTAFNYSTKNSFSNDEIEVQLPEDALYTDINFEYKKGKIPVGLYSSLHRVHNKYTPLNKAINIKVKTIDLPKELEEKALICILDIKTGKLSSIGGQFEKGWVSTSTFNFGDVCVSVDTIAPSIRSQSINNNTLLEKGQIRFKISDDLSGIKKYEGIIDGNWVLFEYDAKRDLLVYNFDDYIKKGNKHTIELTVDDNKGNSNTYKASFNY